MTERDRFEYAWREEYPLHESTIFRRSGLNPDAYVNTRVQDGWLMWQSCSAAHSAGAQGKPAATVINYRGANGNLTSGVIFRGKAPEAGTELYAHPQPMPQTDAARDQLRHFANAERFNRAVFADDSAFADWVIRRSRHVLAEIERIERAKGE